MAIKTQPIIQLIQSDRDRNILIEADEEQDRFVMTVSAAIEACKAYGKSAEFNQQFKAMQSKLGAWIQTREADIDEAYLTVRDEAILLLVVQKSEAFNQALEESLTALDIAIAQDEELSLIRLNVLSLPSASEDSIQSFLVSGSASL